jgi:hypothetical protein
MPDEPRYLKRNASMIVGVLLSVLVHVLAILLVIERNPPINPVKVAGSSDRLAVTLLSPPATPVTPSVPAREASEKPNKPASPKKKTIRHHAQPVTRPEPVSPPVVAKSEPKQKSETKDMPPPPADDMASMLAAARKRRAQAQQHDSAAAQEDDTQRRNRLVQANIATSMGQAFGTAQNGHGGVFQIRRVGAISAEFLFRGWNPDLNRNSTMLVEVVKKSEPDIQTAIVKKMIEIIRESKHEDFLWESYRLGKEVTLSARPQDEGRLEQFLMQEFFADYVPVKQ